MSENNQTDTTSFASILAGVQRLRDEGQVRGEDTQITSQKSQSNIQKPSLSNQNTVNRQQSQNNVPNYQNSNNININNTTPTTQRSTSGQQKRLSDKLPSKQKSPVLVNKLQTDNPLLKSLTNINWSYVESRHDYDYYINNRNILFLLLKYHKLKPEYITKRMKPLIHKDSILIFIIDVENNYDNILKDVNKLCLFNEFTLLVAFTFEEAAKYITFLALS